MSSGHKAGCPKVVSLSLRRLLADFFTVLNLHSTKRTEERRLIKPANTLRSFCISNRQIKHSGVFDAKQRSWRRGHRVIQVFTARVEPSFVHSFPLQAISRPCSAQTCLVTPAPFAGRESLHGDFL